MEGNLHLRVNTPSKLVFEGSDIQSVLLPTASKGQVGILFNHEPMLSIISIGLVTITRQDKSQEQIFVKGGVVEVGPESTCNILTQEATPLTEINMLEMQEAIKMLQNKLESEADMDIKGKIQEEINALKLIEVK